MRKFLAILFLAAAIFFGWSFKYTYSTKLQEPDIDKELKKVATKSYLESKIKNALETKNLDEAQSYISLAKYLNINIDKELLQEYQKEQKPMAAALRSVKDFAKGFISGKSSNSASLSGSVVSDFTIVGDLRDTYIEGSKYLNSEPYDKFLLNISLIGLAITASSYASFGATAPVKTGVSIIKSGYKSGKLSKGFIKILDKKLSKSVNLKLLKKADFSSFSKMKQSSKIVAKSINPKPLEALLKQLNRINKNTSLSDSVKLLKYVKSEKDLAKLVKLSNKYKKGTLAVFKTLGKRVLRAGKVVVKYSVKFVLNIAGFVLSVIGFLVSLSILIKKRNYAI